eukprot:TRINITY_DN21084_c0_g1_i1.p1 TRINITY_DN21084_c0_g1~~TRINITY_DN21084_c0_g1_i1.p1  ORF type:complete len:443 (+),score=32.82 TRINITY_DN21084_c0_g1_i1:88-1329(+)
MDEWLSDVLIANWHSESHCVPLGVLFTSLQFSRLETNVWTWGEDAHGRLGHVHGPQQQPVPTNVVQLQHLDVIAVSAGDFHTVALTAGGKVYSWGGGHSGQLGHGDCDSRATPTLVEFFDDKEIVAVNAGSVFTLAVSRSGHVWMCGRLHQECIHTPRTLPELATENVTQVAGKSVCLALTDAGTLWSWDVGATKTQTAITGHDNPRPTAILHDVVAMDNYGTLCIALQADGSLHTWGCSRYGGLGQVSAAFIGKSVSQVPRNLHTYCPHTFEGTPPLFCKVAAGKDFCCAVDVEGRFYAWGSNHHGTVMPDAIMHSGTVAQRQESTFGPHLNSISHLVAGSCIHIITTDGSLWSWGNGVYGQLGTGGHCSSETPRKCPYLHHVEDVSSGHHHTVALTVVACNPSFLVQELPQ